MQLSSDEDALTIPPVAVPVLYGIRLLGWGAFLLVLHHFWRDYILVGYDEIVGTGLSWSGIGAVWFIFAWAIGISLLRLAVGARYESDDSRGVLLLRGIWISLNAGVFEEIIYRWFIFMSAMVTIPFVNFITFGLIKFLYVELLVPLANFTTFGALEPYLYHPSSWIFGAAIVSTSMSFSEAHKHLGLLGRVNSWFGGMVMFWLMFNYGLLTAMAAHVLYDIVVFGLKALTAMKPRWSTQLARTIMGLSR